MSSVGHLYGFGNTLDKALTGVVGVQGAWPSGGRTARSLDWERMGGSKTTRTETGHGWVKKDTGWKVDGGAVLRREVGQERHNVAGARKAAAADDATNQHQQAKVGAH